MEDDDDDDERGGSCVHGLRIMFIGEVCRHYLITYSSGGRNMGTERAVDTAR